MTVDEMETLLKEASSPNKTPHSTHNGRMKMKEAELKAYALGYFHGRTEGLDGDPYVDGVLRHLYGRGYDAGVADYADFDMATDETRSNGPRAA